MTNPETVSSQVAITSLMIKPDLQRATTASVLATSPNDTGPCAMRLCEHVTVVERDHAVPSCHLSRISTVPRPGAVPVLYPRAGSRPWDLVLSDGQPAGSRTQRIRRTQLAGKTAYGRGR